MPDPDRGSVSSRVMHRFKELPTSLSRVPALAYVAAYPILILVFTLIFHALPDWRYRQAAPHSNLSPGETEAVILADLQLEIERLYRDKGADSLVFNGWHLLLDQLQVSYLGASSPVDFYFHLMLPARRESDCAGCTSAIMQADVSVFSDGRYIRGDTVYLPFALTNAPLPAGIPPETPQPWHDFLYDQREILMQMGDLSEGSTESEREWNAKLPLSQGLYDHIIAYIEMLQGPPPNNYERVLYLSTIAATFGAPKEIVDGSGLVPLLVFVEAVLVAALIALFANSLVYRLVETIGGKPSQKRGPRRTAVGREKKLLTKRAANSTRLPQKKGSRWWNSAWVKFSAGVIVGGVVVALTIAVALIRLLIAELDRTSYGPGPSVFATTTPTASPIPPTWASGPTLRPIPMPEVLSNGWYKFTDREAGYSISYPPGTSLHVESGYDLEFDRARIDFPDSVGGRGQYQAMGVTAFTFISGSSLEQIVYERLYANKERMSANDILLTPIKIAGLAAVKMERAPFHPAVLIPAREKVFVMYLGDNMLSGNAPTEASVELFYQIIDTFKLN